MIHLWDYACKACGKRYLDHPYQGAIPKSIACNCGSRATWAMQRKNHIHPTISGRKYGEWDPQFGCVVEDYGHKKQLMRERGMVEVGPVSREEAHEGPVGPEPTDVDSSQVVRLGDFDVRDGPQMERDIQDAVNGLIPQDRADRRATGPPRPSQDFWGGF